MTLHRTGTRSDVRNGLNENRIVLFKNKKIKKRGEKLLTENIRKNVLRIQKSSAYKFLYILASSTLWTNY